ncbi:uncharacterized protein Z520_05958 [Fonsecaea multimorphosa CBS 102226]|uniref:Uncharacterized protein n=1 Tax=Fonsecaea multimorphosa CBS 102226 TaxID=1442371 RepID=A0A0D2JYN9_9EURO|nr:uncharacterized protein Z520_05958 [Fonsecaea multimorphosa CBS 102226]KIX98657.1 hypothetical protein Z520_05958 [Fonsecaea multimorphosa CBS 102226]OAL24843.1 hypothetical protein AYO22_05632 [Fonsecaea multimorphosa]
MSSIPLAVTRAGRIFGLLVAPSFASLIAAAIVGSVPALKDAFFTSDAFIKNSFVSATSQLADVAIEIWLVVIGGRAARNATASYTSAQGELQDDLSTLILISLLAKMLLPVLFMSSFLALLTRNEWALVSNDPSLLLVSILVAGSPIAYELMDVFQRKGIWPGLMPRIVSQAWTVW